MFVKYIQNYLIFKPLFYSDSTSHTVRARTLESPISLKIDYFNNLFIYLPQYQTRSMIKLQKSCASIAKRKFCSAEDVVPLKRLLLLFF